MKAFKVISEQKTVSEEKWSEIEKLAALCRIKNELADLFESAPELDMSETLDFIMSMTERELKRRM